MLTTTSGSSLLTPTQVAALLVQPARDLAVCTQVSTVVTTGASTFRIPIVTADPSAAWTFEGQEIAPSDATVDELIVTPSKLAGLSIISRELANDTSPAAAEVVGQGLARDVARKLDEAFFGSMAAPAPNGLAALDGVTVVIAPSEWTDADPFIAATFGAENVDANLTAFVANPVDAEALANLKESSDSNRPLLAPDGDVTRRSRRVLAGVPLYVSRFVAPGTVWGIPGDRVHVVIRENAEILADRSAFFTSDRVAVRAILRAGFAFPHPEAIVKITVEP